MQVTHDDSSNRNDQPSLSQLIGHQRSLLSIYILEKTRFSVVRGPFKGMQFLQTVSGWSSADLGCMALGLYEQEILTEIDRLDQVDTFINLGGADGYYSVGLVKSGIAQRAFYFESDERAHANCRTLADLNNVRDSVVFYGTADSNFLDHVSYDESKSNLLLADIEGGEFELFANESMFDRLSSFTVIIEIHAQEPERLLRTKYTFCLNKQRLVNRFMRYVHFRFANQSRLS
jgi:hypothetical protein